MVKSSKRPCYFTCVLSEALEYNLTLPTTKTCETRQGLVCEHQEYRTISEFVNFLGNAHGHHLAVGCVAPTKISTKEKTTYVEVLSAYTFFASEF
jgi:hypothetical protein